MSILQQLASTGGKTGSDTERVQSFSKCKFWKCATASLIINWEKSVVLWTYNTENLNAFLKQIHLWFNWKICFPCTTLNEWRHWEAWREGPHEAPAFPIQQWRHPSGFKISISRQLMLKKHDGQAGTVPQWHLHPALESLLGVLATLGFQSSFLLMCPRVMTAHIQDLEGVPGSFGYLGEESASGTFFSLVLSLLYRAGQGRAGKWKKRKGREGKER